MDGRSLIDSVLHMIRRPILRGVLVPLFLGSTGILIIPLTSPLIDGAGDVVLAASVVLFLWTEKEMMIAGAGTASPDHATAQLTTTGPFALVRNPLYDATMLLALGEAVLFRSVLVLAWLLFLWWRWFRGVPRGEEPRLRQRFGAAYDDYCARVPRWIPRLPWRRD